MKKIFFVGIKGVGMTALAVLAKQAGFTVSGSDVAEEFITDQILKKEGIAVFSEFGEDSIRDFLDSGSEALVIYTGAHGGSKNLQVKLAQELGVKTLNYGKAVGEFMRGDILERNDLEGISVAASHGKTTTSAMLSTFLKELNVDPSYIIGTSEVFPLGSAGHYGKGKYFVVEADEYVADLKDDCISKFLYHTPHYAIINNIDFDHPDVFNTIEDIELAFEKFVKRIKKDGILVVNGDDERVMKVVESVKNEVRIVTYGVSPQNMYSIKDFQESGLSTQFTIDTHEFSLGEFSLSVPGFHNAKNSLGALALLIELGISVKDISRVFPLFKGTKRRMEYIGRTSNGAEVMDDYAHHPLEIKTTLHAIREAYSNKKIVCVFQPHTYSRTKALLPDFVSSLSIADSIVLLPTFASAREEGKAESMEEEWKAAFDQIDKAIYFPKNQDNVVEYLDQKLYNEEYVLITMGAGDVYKIASKVVKSP